MLYLINGMVRIPVLPRADKLKELLARGDPKLAVHVMDMRANRIRRDEQHLGKLCAPMPLRKKHKDLAFPFGKRVFTRK